MTIAEIHGKLSSEGTNLHDRLEDLLTSDVFGTFKYLGPEAICRFLSGGHLFRFRENLTPARIDWGGESVDRIEYKFWPRIGTREPDLILRFYDKTDSLLCSVIVEAKYTSGPSDVTIERAVESNASREEDSVLTGNQLADYYEFYKEEGKPKYLVYCTAHYSPPLEEYHKAMGAMRNPGAHIEEYFFWTSWRMVYKFFDSVRENQSALTKDLLLLLERKGFDPLNWTKIAPSEVGYPEVKFFESVERFDLDVEPPSFADVIFWEDHGE